jgi:hypothetical protein
MARFTLLLLALLMSPSATLADEIQDRFDEAMAAVEADKPYTARGVLSDLVDDYPSLHRARIELARVEYKVFDFDAAEANVLEVLADPEVPPTVRTTLLAFLAQIRDDSRSFRDKHYWGGNVYGGGMYDSNIRFGTSRDVVDIGFGQTAVPDPILSDFAGVIDTGFTHTYSPGWKFKSGEDTGFFLWQSLGQGYYRAYIEENDFNLGNVTARTGPAWVVSEKWRASIGLQADWIWFGDDINGDHRRALFLNLNPTFVWFLDPASTLTFDGALVNREYDEAVDQPRNGDLYNGSITYDRAFAEGKWTLQVGGGYTNLDADAEQYSYRSPQVFAGTNWHAWQRGNVYATVGYRAYDFKGIWPIFQQNRDDDEYRLSAGFTHNFNAAMAGWALLGEWSYIYNDSNLTLFDFDRHEISLGLSRAF